MGVAFKLCWAGVYANASTPDTFCNQAVAVGPQDVVIGVSHQGRTRDTIEAIRLARSFGATTIALSTVAHAPLSMSAEISVAVLTPAIARSSTFLVANSTLLYLADILSLAVMQRVWNGTPPHRDEVIEWIEKMMRVGPVAATDGKQGSKRLAD
jgi:DNA-binding MurR/RpiR family transcriptional regulator